MSLLRDIILTGTPRSSTTSSTRQAAPLRPQQVRAKRWFRPVVENSEGASLPALQRQVVA